MAGPKVSIIKRFHCRYYWLNYHVWIIPMSWAGKGLDVVLTACVMADDAQDTTPTVL